MRSKYIDRTTFAHTCQRLHKRTYTWGCDNDDISATSFITKPVKFDALVDVIKALGKYWLEIVELPNETNGG